MCILPLSIISILVVYIHYHLVSNYKHKVVNKVGIVYLEVGFDRIWNIDDNSGDSMRVVWCYPCAEKAGKLEHDELYFAEPLQ